MYLDQGLYDLACDVVRAYGACGMTVATAESCTGGLVSGTLTAVAGSSSVVRGGIVSYATQIKEAVLGVPTSITQDPYVGVVSEECAMAMAEGARRVLGSDVAVSVTGIAGPGGEEPGKPIGTVWLGLATPSGARAECHLFAGDRAQVRAQAVHRALTMLLDGLKTDC